MCLKFRTWGFQLSEFAFGLWKLIFIQFWARECFLNTCSLIQDSGTITAQYSIATTKMVLMIPINWHKMYFDYTTFSLFFARSIADNVSLQTIYFVWFRWPSRNRFLFSGKHFRWGRLHKPIVTKIRFLVVYDPDRLRSYISSDYLSKWHLFLKIRIIVTDLINSLFHVDSQSLIDILDNFSEVLNTILETLTYFLRV